MKKTPAFAACCLLALSIHSQADTFTLKDGTVLEGKVLKEEGDSYVLEVQVTKSIKDERTVAKADVVKMDRERPDLKAFEAIQKFTPAPDLLKEEEYVVHINTVEKFLKTYSVSTKAREAKEILETLRKERQEVAAGGVKIGGKIISKEDYKANEYDFDARVMEARIRKLAAEEQIIPALRVFVEFDRDFRTTLSYGALLPLARQLVQTHLSESQQLLASLDARIKERQTGLQRMVSEDRATTEGAIKEQEEAIEARFKAEKEGSKEVWVTTSPYHKASLDEAVRFGQQELTRISAVKTELGMDGGKAYRELYSAVKHGGDAAAVVAAVTAAKAAFIPERYIKPLETEAQGRQ